MGVPALKLRPHERERVRAIVDALATLDCGERAVLDTVLPEVCALFESPRGMAHAYVERGEGLAIDFFHAVGMRPDLQAWYDDWLSRRSVDVTSYGALRPEPAQRNRALLETDLARLNPNYFETPVRSDVYTALGVGRDDQVRVLVCDGASLLAWVGVLRPERFSARHRSLLQSLVRPMRRRLRLERALGMHALVESALVSALEALVQPAIVVRAGPRVLYSNGAARRLLDSRRRDTVEELSRALAGKTSTFALSKIRSPGAGTAFLAVARRELVMREERESFGSRVAMFTRAWQLTPREAEVLHWLARGDSNKEIALRLSCAEVSVERHVTSLLRKSGCDGRGRLLARFYARVEHSSAKS